MKWPWELFTDDHIERHESVRHGTTTTRSNRAYSGDTPGSATSAPLHPYMHYHERPADMFVIPIHLDPVPSLAVTRCCQHQPAYDKETFEHMLSFVDLEVGQKRVIEMRFVRLLVNYGRNSVWLSRWNKTSRILVTVGSLLLPAMLTIGEKYQCASDIQQTAIFWTNLAISLAVTLSNGISEMVSLPQHASFNTAMHARLLNEGMLFINLTGHYKKYKSHRKAFKSFIRNVETLEIKAREESTHIERGAVMRARGMVEASGALAGQYGNAAGGSFEAYSRMVDIENLARQHELEMIERNVGSGGVYASSGSSGNKPLGAYEQRNSAESNLSARGNSQIPLTNSMLVADAYINNILTQNRQIDDHDDYLSDAGETLASGDEEEEENGHED